MVAAFIEKHSTEDEHDCAKAKCRPHTCNSLGASTVRQIHSIISGTLSLAERWEWIDVNPAKVARHRKPKPSEPDPPSPAEAARLSEAAFAMDDDWGTLVWLVMTTGIRRGETVCAPLLTNRPGRRDPDNQSQLGQRQREGHEDTSEPQNCPRLRDGHSPPRSQEASSGTDRELGGKFTDELFVFAILKTPDHRTPYAPNAVTQRYKDMAARLAIKTHLHALRRYSATELLTLESTAAQSQAA